MSIQTTHPTTAETVLSQASRGLQIAEGLAISDLDGIEHCLLMVLQQDIQRHFEQIAQALETEVGVFDAFSLLALANRGKSITKGIEAQYEHGEVNHELLSALYHEMENLFRQIGETLVDQNSSIRETAGTKPHVDKCRPLTPLKSPK